MANVAEGALDPRVAPRRILCRHAHDELTNLDQDPTPSRLPGGGPFPGDQLAMPSQQGVRRCDRRDVPQGCTSDSVRSRSEPTAIVVRETQPTATKLTPQQAVLFDEVRNDLALSAVQPAGQRTEHHLQRHGVDHEPELISWADLNDIGRDVEHYGFALRV